VGIKITSTRVFVGLLKHVSGSVQVPTITIYKLIEWVLRLLAPLLDWQWLRFSNGSCYYNQTNWLQY